MWFKVDDGWWRHRKTRRLIRSHPAKRRDAGAAGFWALAGNWCAGAGTDGWVPEDELEQFDDDWGELAKRLVVAEYWVPEAMDGEPGYRFINWPIYQPAKADVDRAREAQGRMGREGNHKRWHAKRGVVDPECEFCQASGTRSGKRSGKASGTRSGDRQRPDSGTPSGDRIGSESGNPIRPDPIPPSRPGPARPDPSTGDPLY